MLAYVQYLSKLFKQEEPSYVLSANADKLVLISLLPRDHGQGY